MNEWMTNMGMELGLSFPMFKMIFCMILSIFISPVLHVFSTPLGRHLSILCMGCSMALFVFHDQMIHSLGSCMYVYLLLHVAPRESVGKMVLGITFLHLLYCHTVRVFGNVDIAHDSAQMVITLKLTGLAMNFADGASKAGRDSNPHALQAIPHPLHLLSFVYFFPTFFAGPTFEFSDYIRWIESRKVAPYNVHFRNLFRLAICVTGYILSGYLPIEKFDSPELFPIDRPFLRCFLLGIAACLFRYHLYLAWALSELSGTLAGMGHNEVTGKWDQLNNIDMMLVEVPTCPRAVINSWNIKTAQWLNKYVYNRVGLSSLGKPTGMSTVATFGLSALWHGFELRYYLFFIGGALLLEIGKASRRALRPYFHYSEDRKAHPYAIFFNYKGDHPLAIVYDILGSILTWAMVQYFAIMFEVYDWKRTLILWGTFYYIPNFVAIFVLLVLRVLPRKEYKVKTA